MYGVIPSLFGPRALADVRARLPELAALGIDTLWLAPIGLAPPGDYGYEPLDHFVLRPEAGSEADLRALVQEAHRRGLRVLLDFVPNHTSRQHRFFRDAEARGKASPYHAFYERGADGAPTHHFDWKHLPNLDHGHPEVRRHILEAALHWVRTFDVDGFRVDVAWGVTARAPSFWDEWRRELKKIKPSALLIAEASARDPAHLRGAFDAAYDWTDQPGHWSWGPAFASPEQGGATTPTEMADRLRAALAVPPASDRDGLVMRFLNNNDTGPRFITRHGLGRYRVALTMLLTLPGLPALFTGDEHGAEYQPYDEGPPLAWKDPHGLRPFHAQRIALRRRQPALTGGGLQILPDGAGSPALAYLRPGSEPGDHLVVALNFDGAPRTLQIEADGAVRELMNAGALADVVTGQPLPTRPGTPLRITLPPFGSMVIGVSDRVGPRLLTTEK